jgi:cytochrome c biogenesis protein CcdA
MPVIINIDRPTDNYCFERFLIVLAVLGMSIPNIVIGFMSSSTGDVYYDYIHITTIVTGFIILTFGLSFERYFMLRDNVDSCISRKLIISAMIITLLALMSMIPPSAIVINFYSDSTSTLYAYVFYYGIMVSGVIAVAILFLIIDKCWK